MIFFERCISRTQFQLNRFLLNFDKLFIYSYRPYVENIIAFRLSSFQIINNYFWPLAFFGFGCHSDSLQVQYSTFFYFQNKVILKIFGRNLGENITKKIKTWNEVMSIRWYKRQHLLFYLVMKRLFHQGFKKYF